VATGHDWRGPARPRTGSVFSSRPAETTAELSRLGIGSAPQWRAPIVRLGPALTGPLEAPAAERRCSGGDVAAMWQRSSGGKFVDECDCSTAAMLLRCRKDAAIMWRRLRSGRAVLTEADSDSESDGPGGGRGGDHPPSSAQPVAESKPALPAPAWRATRSSWMCRVDTTLHSR
jgi:hypothetical protein